MKKRKIKFLIMLFLYTMCIAALAPQANATEVNGGEIPVTIDLGDSIPLIDKQFEIVLRPENSNNPMPENSRDGIYSVFITGAGTQTLPRIDFSSVGKYSYTISQKIENEEVDEYDTAVYILNVQVSRSVVTGRLQATSTLYELGQSEKVAGAVFYNAPPRTPEEPTEPPTLVPPPTSEEIVDKQIVPEMSDEVSIWPYVTLFVSSSLILSFIVLNIKRDKNAFL